MYSTSLCYQTLGRTVRDICLPGKNEFLAYVIIILKSQNKMIVKSVTVTFIVINKIHNKMFVILYSVSVTFSRNK